MQLKTLAIVSLFSLAAAQQAAPSPATTMAFTPADSAENPEDIHQLMKKKCPEEKCPKPKHITVTKNITKVQSKTITKTINC